MSKNLSTLAFVAALISSAGGAPAETPPGAGPFTSRPPYQAQRMDEYAKRNQIDAHTVVFLGDSITEGWKVAAAFPRLRVSNRGISSDTTRGMLGRLQTSVLDLEPQAVVLLGGINDLRPTNRPRGTPETITGNVELILRGIQAVYPEIPVFVCEILPSGIGTPELIRSTNKAVDQVTPRFPKAIRVRTHDRFLGADGVQDRSLYTDGVHLSPKGYGVLQEVLDGEFKKINLQRINTAVIPVPQKGNGYNWMDRHNAILKLQKEGNPDLVFIGDSITHHWGGPPHDRLKNGESVLKTAFPGHRILNLGFGSDRLQQMLWRLDHGELEGTKPRWVVLNIGTNNTSDGNTSEEIMAGIRAVCERVRKLTPEARIILMSIFPREEKPTAPRRVQIGEINRMIADYARRNDITHLDIGAKFLAPNGNIQKALMPDFCHPVAKGYQFWAEALVPLLK